MLMKLWNMLLAGDGDAGAGGGTGGAAGGAQTGAGASGDGGAGASGADSGANGSATTLLNDKFEFVEGWQEMLPDEFNDLKPTFANFRDLKTFGEAFKENMTKARAKTEGMVKVPAAPGKDAKPEEIEAHKAEMAAFRKAYGVPDAPEGYELKAPEKLPDGVQWNEQTATEFAKVAHELGLTPAQASKLSEFQMGLTANQFQSNLANLAKYDQEQDAAIMRAFGDNADKRMVDVKRACMTLFGSGDLPVDRAELTIGLAKLADLVAEDKLVTTGQAANKLGPAAMAREIMSDPTSPYNNLDHPRHKETVEQVKSLMQKAYPG